MRRFWSAFVFLLCTSLKSSLGSFTYHITLKRVRQSEYHKIEGERERERGWTLHFQRNLHPQFTDAISVQVMFSSNVFQCATSSLLHGIHSVPARTATTLFTRATNKDCTRRAMLPNVLHPFTGTICTTSCVYNTTGLSWRVLSCTPGYYREIAHSW